MMRPTSTILIGDACDKLATLSEQSVHCAVTRPPYWGLRKYLGDDDPLEAHELGLEATPEEYITRMVEVFRGVRRVLRDDGTLWLNVGDKIRNGEIQLIPYRLAEALRKDGWCLSGIVTWFKTDANTDTAHSRPRQASEPILVLHKGRPYWDIHAVPYLYTRNVWPIATSNFKEAHFATFPRRLVETCLRLGTSDKGCCPECGTPWVRIVESNRQPTRPGRDNKQDGTGLANRDSGRHVTETRTVGWLPGCDCHGREAHAHEMAGCVYDVGSCKRQPCTVLDPFCGSGTTGVVAKQLGRNFVGIDLNPDYAAMAERRIANPEPEPVVVDVPGQMMLMDE